ncbi:MAG TPA: hypothetical protein VFY64_01385 [Nitrososphaeraceae archaeon]|nr:hypothetical protein [Nitrososphaeraceae archaeon]
MNIEHAVEEQLDIIIGIIEYAIMGKWLSCCISIAYQGIRISINDFPQPVGI